MFFGLIFKSLNRLTETAQDSHTWFSASATSSSTLSSRIDRVYISEGLLYNNAFEPAASLAHIPYGILGSDLSRISFKRKKSFRSDHHPVMLRFFPHDNAPNTGNKRIPDWVITQPRFKDLITDYWDLCDDDPPFVQLAKFKTAIKKATSFSLKHRDLSFGPKGIHNITKAFTLLRMGTCLNPDVQLIHKEIGSNQELKRFASPEGIHVESLNDYIFDLLNLNCDFMEDDTPVNTQTGTFLKNLKRMLPSTRKKVHQLRAKAGGPPTSVPAEMAAIARGFWQDIWKERDRSLTPSQVELDDYLSACDSTVSANPPSIPDLDDILDAITSSNNSSPGPDGIPFAIYRLCAQDIGPVLHECLLELASTGLSPDGFNWGNLHLIPKKDSDLIANTRPISVTNADNRIIAKAITSSLYETTDDIISQNQRGFVPGRQGNDHIRLLNSLFYEDCDYETFLLLLDVMKAFDSVDHNFIYATLKKINMPIWVINAVKALLSNVQVTPVLGGDAAGWIQIRRGVKQGCPLSPLLFIIIYDVFVRKINGLIKTKIGKACAFADDVMAITRDLMDLFHIHTESLLFEKMVGCKTHPTKSFLISSKKNSPTLRDWVDSHTFWNRKTVKNRGTYLGILFGSNINLQEIFDPAIKKFTDRIGLRWTG